MKKYCIDIDGTICTNTNGNYEKAEPFPDRIEQINQNEGISRIYLCLWSTCT